MNILRLKQDLPVLPRRYFSHTGRPAPDLLLLRFFELQAVDAARPHLRCDGNAGIFQSSQIQRLTNSVLCKQSCRKKFIRCGIRQDPAVIHQNDSVHIPVKHVLQAVLDDHHGSAALPSHILDQLHGSLTGRRIQIRERLVKQQQIHLIHHHARQSDPLLLSAGEIFGCMMQVTFDVNKESGSPDPFVQLRIPHTFILECKCNILRHCQSDKLSVRILEDCTHSLRDLKQTHLLRLPAANHGFPCALTAVGKRDQPVDTAGKS